MSEILLSKRQVSDFTSTIYLDWNIFNKLEHLKDLESEIQPHYRLIYELIIKGYHVAPYSNAHISDLSRGYHKDPSFTPGHLANISNLTNNLCLTQYWGQSKATWHYRAPKEYLESAIDDNEEMATTFTDLLMSISDNELGTALANLQTTLLKMTPIPVTFKQIYTLNPIFNSIYPRTKIEMNVYALCEDLYSFTYKVRNDYALYKNFRKFLAESKQRLPQYQKLFNSTESNLSSKPNYLTWDEIWDQAAPKYKGSANPNYDKIMKLFTTTDLKGYRQDERFANMIDDALHCFYAAHCDYFITIDKRCADKAKLVYQKLNIATRVLSPSEFNEYASSIMSSG
jgi:hypothetical protein